MPGYVIPLLLVILLLVILFLIPKCKKKTPRYTELFLSKINSSRIIKYGDTVLLWSSRNAYIRKDPTEIVETGPTLATPDAFNLSWVWEPYIIQDMHGIGNSGPVSYGDSVRFQTWSRNWLGLDVNNKYLVGTNDQAKNVFQIMQFSTADSSIIKSDYISYGDSILLKNSAGTYVSCPPIINGSSGQVVQASATDVTTKLVIIDKYGNGAQIDWAKRGIATQSSDYSGNIGYNAIDGDINSMSCTNSELNAWWKVKMPQDINIVKIKILNRMNCCQDRLANFDIMLLDENGIITKSIYQKEALQTFIYDNVNVVARYIKIMLRGTNYLHVAEVSIYGDNAEYSQLLEKPISADIISKKVVIDGTTTINKIIESADLPYIGKVNSSTMSFMINFANSNNVSIISKNYAPNISVKNNELVCAVQTSPAGLPTGTGIKLITINTNYIIEPKKWTHITIITKSKIDSSTGWRYGLIAGTPYYLNSDLKQIYKTAINKNLLVIPPTWSADILTKYTLMDADTNFDKNKITIIINGMIQIEQILTDMPVFNTSPLIIGDESTINPNLYIAPSAEGFHNPDLFIKEGFDVSEDTKKLIEEKQLAIVNKQEEDAIRHRNAENMLLAKKQLEDSLKANAALKAQKAITAPKSYIFMINQVKMYNYAVTINQLEHDYSYANITFNLYHGPNINAGTSSPSGTTPATTPATTPSTTPATISPITLSFEPNQMPTIIEEYSMAFWFLAKKNSIIYTHDARTLGIDETMGLYIMNNKQKYILNAVLKDGTWYLHTESYADGTTKIYINRQLKNELAIMPLPTFSHTRLNIKSAVYTLKYSNYAYDIAEVLNINYTHPEHIIRDSINKEWMQMGCPMKLSDDYLDLLSINKKSMDADNFKSLLNEIKAAKDNKQVCYGDFTSNILAECARNKDLINMKILPGTVPNGADPDNTEIGTQADIAANTAKLIEYNKKLTDENDLLKQEILAKKAGIEILTPTQKTEALNILTELKGMNISPEFSGLLDNMTTMVSNGHPLTEIFDLLKKLNSKEVKSNSLLYQKFKSKVKYFYNLQN